MGSFECQGCGRIVYAGEGHWTSWGGKWNPPKFFCFRCLTKMEAQEREARSAKWREIAEFAKTVSTQAKLDEIAMGEALRELCQIEGWYAVKKIAEEFKTKLKLKQCDPRTASKVLRRLGFTQRARKKRGSHVHAYIDPKKIPANA